MTFNAKIFIKLCGYITYFRIQKKFWKISSSISFLGTPGINKDKNAHRYAVSGDKKLKKER